MAKTPVSAIPISPLARAALFNVGITTLEDAAEKSDEFLLGLRGFATLSLNRLRDWQKGVPQAPILKMQREGSDDGRLFELYSKLILTEETEEEALRKARVALAVFEEEASDG